MVTQTKLHSVALRLCVRSARENICKLCMNIKLAVENLSCLINTTNEVLYLDRQFGCGQALLKVSNVMLRNSKHTLQTYDPR